MQIDWTLATTNLTSVAVLVFFLGFLASRINSDMRIPEPIYQMISIYLLFGIGLKGGHGLKSTTFSSFALPAVATIAMGLLIPVIAFFLLNAIKGLSVFDRGAIAAHYGSTSLVTFSAALLFLENNLVKVEGFATALLTLLEIPGIIVGVYLGSKFGHSKVSWNKTLTEVITGRTVLLLVGGYDRGYWLGPPAHSLNERFDDVGAHIKLARGAGGEGQFSGKPAIAGGGHGEGEMGLLPGPATGEGQEPADGPLDPVRIAGEAHPVDEIEHDGMTWLERPAAAGIGRLPRPAWP